MADMTTYTGVTPITKKLTAVAVGRALRVVLDSSGTVAVAGIAVRGDYITLQDGVASAHVQVVPIGTPAKVPQVASEIVAVNDPAYSAASGKASKTAGGGAVIIGKWVQAAGADEIGEVQLAGNPAA